MSLVLWWFHATFLYFRGLLPKTKCHRCIPRHIVFFFILLMLSKNDIERGLSMLAQGALKYLPYEILSRWTRINRPHEMPVQEPSQFMCSSRGHLSCQSNSFYWECNGYLDQVSNQMFYHSIHQLRPHRFAGGRQHICPSGNPKSSNREMQEAAHLSQHNCPLPDLKHSYEHRA